MGDKKTEERRIGKAPQRVMREAKAGTSVHDAAIASRVHTAKAPRKVVIESAKINKGTAVRNSSSNAKAEIRNPRVTSNTNTTKRSEARVLPPSTTVSAQTVASTPVQIRKTQTKPPRKERKEAKGQHSSMLILLVVLFSALVVFGLIYLNYRSYQKAMGMIPGLVPASTHVPNSEEINLNPNAVIPQSISVGTTYIGGVTVAEARKKLEATEDSILDGLPGIELSFGNEKLKTHAKSLGLHLDINRILATALQSKPEARLENVYKVSPEAMDKGISDLVSQVDRPAKDAEVKGFNLETMSFEFGKEQSGFVVNREKFKEMLNQRFRHKEFGGAITLPVKETPPGKTAGELSSKLGLVAQATTPILSQTPGRQQNVARAAKLLNGYVIKPHSVFSYWDVLSPITLENGYADAGMQAAGMDASGIGGGLCQPSTTLFQAAVKAGLYFAEHHNHSQPVGYCKIGEDAMVSDWADFKISNDTDYPYAIVSHFDGASLGFSIYGLKLEDGMTVRMVVEDNGPVEPGPDQTAHNAELKPGETKVKRPRIIGSRATLYRQYVIGDKVVKSEVIDKFYYEPFPAIIEHNLKTSESSKATETDPLFRPGSGLIPLP